MKNCPNCNNELKDYESLCNKCHYDYNCGRVLDDYDLNKREQKMKPVGVIKLKTKLGITLTAILAVCMIFVIIGFDNEGRNTNSKTVLTNNTTAVSTQKETQKATQKATQQETATANAITSKLNSIKSYTVGQYKVGVDIPAGEYILLSASDLGYFCVSSDANKNNIVYNDNFETNSIVTVKDGEYLQLSRCKAYNYDDYYNTGLTIKTSKSGIMLKVGKDIQAGEYKISATGSDLAYYCIYSDSRHQDIVSNDNFNGQRYVSISDGQYIKLDRCTIDK